MNQKPVKISWVVRVRAWMITVGRFVWYGPKRQPEPDTTEKTA